MSGRGWSSGRGWKSGRRWSGLVVAASLSLLWSGLAMLSHVLRRSRADQHADRAMRPFTRVAGYSALLFAIIPAVIESVILVMRLVFVAIDLVYGTPLFDGLGYGFTADGPSDRRLDEPADESRLHLDMSAHSTHGAGFGPDRSRSFPQRRSKRIPADSG